jgi:hypothetical protein
MSLFRALGASPADAGKRWASGTFIPTAADEDVASGLQTVELCGVCLAAPPTVLHYLSFAVPSSTIGNVRVRSYRPTDNSDATPIASTTEVAVTWWAIGT